MALSPPPPRPIAENAFSLLWQRSKQWLESACAELTSLGKEESRSTSHTPGILPSEKIQQVQFTYALIALSAKLAAVDGPISREEFLVFRDVFPTPQRRSHKVRQLFFDASFSADDGAAYARQILDTFPARSDLYEEVVERLLSIALADGALTPEERAFLKRLTQIFNVDHSTLQRMMSKAQRKEKGSPYDVLGVAEDASEKQAKKRYHQLLRDYHPDALAAHGAHPDEYEYYARKAAELNAAFEQIAKMRGWK